MPKKKRSIDQLQIVSPCSTDWNRMTGDEKKRFCAECDKFVYDFAQMTRQQVEAIVSINRGRMCARITRKPDGSLLTLETPPVHPIAARRASPVVNATLAVILGLNVPGAALNADALTAQIVAHSDDYNESARAPYGGGEAIIGGAVFDQRGAVMPNAVVKLISDAGVELKTKTSAKGEFTFANVPYGAYIMLVEAPGFYTHVNSNVIVDTPYDKGFEVSLTAKQPSVPRVLSGVISTGLPSSLLDLYQESALIAIVQVGRSVVAGTEQEASEKLAKTELRISERLKGDNGQQALPFYHWVNANYPPTYNQGDKLLVFLRNRESDDGKQLDGFESAGWGNGVKKLDAGPLDVYRQRIEELTAIFQRGDPNPSEIVEWLTRCVEEPATREDGVSKLTNILSVAASQRHRMDIIKSQLVNVEELTAQQESDESDESDDEDAEEQSSDSDMTNWRRESLKLAAALTEDQKTRMANALFGISELSENDMDMVSLIRELGDERLLPYLVSQLRRVADREPRVAGSLVREIADVVNDLDLNRLASDYRDAARYVWSEGEGEPDRQDSTQNRDADRLAVAAQKRSAMLKDFLKLVDYKTQRKVSDDVQPGVR
jgi:hypothetical protein